MTIEIILMGLFLLPLGRLRRGLKGKEEAIKTVEYATIFSIGGLAIIFMAMFFLGDTVGSQLHEEIVKLSKTLSTNENFVKSIGIKDLSTEDRVDKIVKVYSVLENIFPGILCIVAAIIAYFEYNLMVRFATKGENRPFAFIMDFNLDSKTWISFIIMYIISFLMELGNFPIGKLATLNINTIIEAMLILQGMSCMLYVSYKKNIKKVIPLILMAILLVSGVGKILIYFLGLIDVVFSLRERV